MSKYWNENVKGLEPYIPGEQPKDKKYIKLTGNFNSKAKLPKSIPSFFPSPALVLFLSCPETYVM